MYRKELSILMNLAMLSMVDSESNEEMNWDYIKFEYELIQKKKSKLSRRERQWIADTWEAKLKENQLGKE